MYPYNNLNVFRGLTKMFRVLATRGASAFRGATLQVTWWPFLSEQSDELKKVWNISNLVNLAGAARPGCPLFQADVLPTRVRFWIWCQVSPPDHCWTPISIGVSVLQKLRSLFLLRYIAYFDRADIDGWELRKVCVATQLLIARILLWFDEMSFLSLLTLLATREWVICAQWTWCPNHPLLPLPWGLAGGSMTTPSPPGMHRVQMGPHFP